MLRSIMFFSALTLVAADLWGAGWYQSSFAVNCYTDEGRRYMKKIVDIDSGYISSLIQRDDVDRLCDRFKADRACPDYSGNTNFFERDERGHPILNLDTNNAIANLDRAVGPAFRILKSIVGKQMSEILWPAVIDSCYDRETVYRALSLAEKKCLYEVVTSGHLSNHSRFPLKIKAKKNDFALPSTCNGRKRADCTYGKLPDMEPLEHWSLWTSSAGGFPRRKLPSIIYGCTIVPDDRETLYTNFPTNVKDDLYTRRETTDTGMCKELFCQNSCKGGYSVLVNGCKTCFCWDEIKCDDKVKGIAIDCSLKAKGEVPIRLTTAKPIRKRVKNRGDTDDETDDANEERREEYEEEDGDGVMLPMIEDVPDVVPDILKPIQPEESSVPEAGDDTEKDPIESTSEDDEVQTRVLVTDRPIPEPKPAVKWVKLDNDRVIPANSAAVKMGFLKLDHLTEEKMNKGKELLIAQIENQFNGRTPVAVDMNHCHKPALKCYTSESMSADCLFFLVGANISEVKPSYSNMCTGKSCSAHDFSGIRTSDFQISNTPDISLPLLHPEGVRKLKLPFMSDTCQANIRYSVIGLRLIGDCELDLSIEEEGYVFTLTSIRFSKYSMHITGQDQEEGFLYPGQVKKRYLGDHFTDSVHYEVRCNSKYVNNYIITDRKGWCERTSEFKLTELACKNNHLLYILGLAILALIGLRYLGNLIGDVFAVVFTLLSVVSTSMALVITTSQCGNCGGRQIYKRAHKCTHKCKYCGIMLASTEYFNDHLKICRSFGIMDKLCLSRNWVLWHFGKLLCVMRYIVDRSTALIIVSVVLFVFTHGVESATKGFTSPISIGLTDWGTKESQVPGNLFNLQSQAVTMKDVFQACDSSRCISKGKMSMKMKAIKGSGVQLETRIENRRVKTSSPIIVTIVDVYERFETSPLYKACKSKVYSGTHFACTGSCSDALSSAEENLCNSVGVDDCPVGYTWQRDDASRLGCEAYTGCISNEDGCAAMKCLHYAIPETCYSVYDVRQGKYYVKICIFHMNVYRCKLLEQDTINSAKDISVILTTQDVNLESSTIAVDKVGNVYAGAICKRTEYADKFGQPKFDFDKPGVGDCGQTKQPEAEIDCSDTDSDINPSHCCMDTFSYASGLSKMGDWYMCDGSLCIKKRDAGEIELTMEVSGIITKVTKVGVVTSISDLHVTGCYDCKSGFTVNGKVSADHAGVYEVKCDKEINIQPKFVSLADTKSDFQLVGHKLDTGDLDVGCSIGGKRFAVKGKLVKEEFKMKHEIEQTIKNYHDKPCGFICHMDDWFDLSHWGIAGSFAKIITIVTCVVIVIAVVWGLKIVLPGLKSLLGDMNNVRRTMNTDNALDKKPEQRRRMRPLFGKTD